MPSLQPYQIEFIQFCLERKVLKFGEYKLKSGRTSPYFIDVGAISDGRSLNILSEFYVKAIQNSPQLRKYFKGFPHRHDQSIIEAAQGSTVLYGPPYKGILLAAAVAMKMDQFSEPKDEPTPFAYSRKEVKDHGEGGLFVGFPFLSPFTSVIVIDDVLTAGTAVKQSLSSFSTSFSSNSNVKALLVAIDRHEKSSTAPHLTAAKDLEINYGLTVTSIITLEHLLEYLESLKAGIRSPLNDHEENIRNWLLNEQGWENLLAYRKEHAPC